jgi:transcriptional regulator with XRE-family HTH domain
LAGINKKGSQLNVVGPQVRALRRQKGWLQVQMARAMQLHGWDISREQFNRLENQARQVLDRELSILAKILGVKMEALFPPNPNDGTKKPAPRLRGKSSRVPPA